MTLGSVISRIGRYGEYGANFILGTGSETIGQSIKAAAKARKATGTNIFRAIGTGFKDGVKATNATVAKEGFFKTLGKSLKALPGNMKGGWKNAGAAGKGFFGKIGGALKPIGKVLPFAFNALFLAMSIPSIVARTKDEGILGGIKETVKSVAKLGVYSLGAAVGAAFGPLGSIACVMGIGMLGEKILGADYKTKKAEEQAKAEEAMQALQQMNAGTNSVQGQTFNAVA